MQSYTERPENVRIEAVAQPDGSSQRCLVVQAAFNPEAPLGEVSCGLVSCCCLERSSRCLHTVLVQHALQQNEVATALLAHAATARLCCSHGRIRLLLPSASPQRGCAPPAASA